MLAGPRAACGASRSATWWLLAGVFAVAAVLRFVDLDRLPGEIYGDIVVQFSFFDEILSGNWPLHFITSAGPLYNWLVAPLVVVLGKTYWTLKVATALTGLAAIGAIYFFARQVVSTEEALAVAFAAAVGRWLLVFSRLGNCQILVPLVVALSLAFAFRALRTQRLRDWIASAAFAASGLYGYAPGFVLPAAILALAAVLLPGERRDTRRLRAFACLLLTIGVLALPFAQWVRRRAVDLSSEAYIVGHLLEAGKVPQRPLSVLGENVLHTALMLHVRGDRVFRSNPPDAPHLDPWSGVLFLLGIASFARPERRRTLAALAVVYVILVAPMLLVLGQPREVPNASRSIGVTPIVYLFVGCGAYAAYERVRASKGGRVAVVFLAFVLSIVGWTNARSYFVDYARHLPNGNLPFGRIIAEAVDVVPPQTRVVLEGCCWGAWGQPEPLGIVYALSRPRGIEQDSEGRFRCDTLDRRRAYYVIFPPTSERIAELEPCAGRPAVHHRVSGVDVFASLSIPPLEAAP